MAFWGLVGSSAKQTAAEMDTLSRLPKIIEGRVNIRRSVAIDQM